MSTDPTADIFAQLEAAEKLPPCAPPAPPSQVPLDFVVRENGLGGATLAHPSNDGNTSLPVGPPELQWTDDGLRGLLVDQFLTLPTENDTVHTFTRAQRHWDRPADLTALFTTSVSPATHTIQPSAEGDGWSEVPLLGAGESATDSVSLNRAVGKSRDFVRGGTGQMPFQPGGLEDRMEARAHETATMQTKTLDPNELLAVPPGFAHGMVFGSDGEVMPESVARDAAEAMQSAGVVVALSDVIDSTWLDEEEKDEEEDKQEEASEQTRTETVLDEPKLKRSDSLDEFLASSEANAQSKRMGGLKDAKKGDDDDKWVIMEDISNGVPDFHEKVPEMAHKYPFELDAFQKRAVVLLEAHESVFVAAHTSAGKTVVAEYAIALAQSHLTRTLYTSPIKALSNQKFRDFKNTFGDVGLLTGDVQIKPDAACLIMTTEILRSMLYKGADLIRDVEWVIFDEVHYINDSDRGVVWEEVIIMLPPHVSIIMLSATVPNTREFAAWVGRTKQRPIHVISTHKRPVPLEHFLYTGNSAKSAKQCFKIVDSSKTFLPNGYKQAQVAIEERNKPKTAPGAGGQAANQAQKRGGNNNKGGHGGHSQQPSDRSIYLALLQFLQAEQLTPCVMFTFSKAKCEAHADALQSVDLTSSAEKSEVHVFVHNAISRLRGSDRSLPQVLRAEEMLKRGIGVHHGGLLPIIKETVELLFQRGLVRVLFATETFAMGVNMPARCVVYDTIRKHDGTGFRNLLPGEYIQMAGRAGRRGLDPTGSVIILIKSAQSFPSSAELHQMMLGKPTRLESRFRLTYNMMLQLLRVQQLRVEDMMARSFSEFGTRKDAAQEKATLGDVEKQLEAMGNMNCIFCDEDLEEYLRLNSHILALRRDLSLAMAANPSGQKWLTGGRIVVINNMTHRNAVGIVLVNTIGDDATPRGLRNRKPAGGKQFWVLLGPSSSDGSALPVTQLTLSRSGDDAQVVAVDAGDVMRVSKGKVNVDVQAVLDRRDSSAMAEALQQMRSYVDVTRKKGFPALDGVNLVKDLRMNDMDVVDTYTRLSTLEKQLDAFKCAKCPELNAHFGQMFARTQLSDQVRSLAHRLSDESLELLPEYNARLAVLTKLKYLDDNGTVLLKGRVACEINTCDDAGALIVTELIFDNAFAAMTPGEIVALLSSLLFQEKNASAPNLTQKLKEGQERLTEAARILAETQTALGIDTPVDEFLRNTFKFGLVEVVDEWAKGMPFRQIMDLTDVLEGSIVRCITRLDETCRDMRNAGQVIGDPELVAKMEEASALIKRDIVFAASLYTQ